ncbi:hypothetical protein QQP08_009420 [Theobroma cacao]|nr:hypothetical protein QQP08_009420 [Theobroma cacao]
MECLINSSSWPFAINVDVNEIKSGKALSAIPAKEHFKPFTGQYYTIVQSTLIVVLETENYGDMKVHSERSFVDQKRQGTTRFS